MIVLVNERQMFDLIIVRLKHSRKSRTLKIPAIDQESLISHLFMMFLAENSEDLRKEAGTSITALMV
ncbi:MAG: hypothetical protein IPH69_17860 [Bacteroidales bacterium]|nr:hypothetical protein [Bacteroidales bacterium]